MQTDSRSRPALDLADMMNGLPPAIAGSLSGFAGAAAPRQNRRLPERILVAAHQACDLGDLDVAAQLLSILETVVGQARGPADPGRRRVMESLIAAHQRLWHLRHADELTASVADDAAGPLMAGMVARKLPPQHNAAGFHEPLDMTDFRPGARGTSHNAQGSTFPPFPSEG